MKRVFSTLAVAGAFAALSSGAGYAQSLGGFPIREPGAHSGQGAAAIAGQKGPLQIIVDANGPGPYRTISKALDDIGDGGVIYVMHGVYNESINIDKSVIIQGDRGDGSGVEINAPMNAPCVKFEPKQGTAHAVVANVSLFSKLNSRAAACVDVGSGVFTLKESKVLGSTIAPAVRIAGGTAMLQQNQISSGSQGVFVEQAHTLSQSFIIDNMIGNNKVGVDIASGSRADVVVAGNEIFDNLDSGVQSSGYGSAKLIGNKIRNNKGAGVILDKYSKLSLVRFNAIEHNQGDGVAVPFGGEGLIEKNEINGNGGKSIFIRDEEKEMKITNNFIVDNAGDGKKKKHRR